MIVCPVCGSDTGVQETRAVRTGLRRRRRCVNRGCPGRVTTVEAVVDGKALRNASVLVLVPLHKLDALAGFVLAMRPKETK